jgi:hypothetical protein
MLEKIIEYKTRITLYQQFLLDLDGKKGVMAIQKRYQIYISRESNKLREALKIFNEKYNNKE